MKRATVTLPDELARAVERYAQSQEAPPALTAIVQTALRQFLAERGFGLGRKRLRIQTAPSGSGKRDISCQHDRYLAEE